MTFHSLSEMQNAVDRIHVRADFDAEGEYYRLEFGCGRFKHISEAPPSAKEAAPDHAAPVRWKWWARH